MCDCRADQGCRECCGDNRPVTSATSAGSPLMVDMVNALRDCMMKNSVLDMADEREFGSLLARYDAGER